MTVRAGYGVNYNLGAYGSIAQKLAAQPPFAVTSTSLGTAFVPLLVVDPFAAVDSATTTNSFGIDRTYDLGVAQIWNGDVQKDLPRNVTVSLGYTGTKGSNLDIQRAPNRNPDGGLRIEGVQPFLWQSSEGRSTLHCVHRARAQAAVARHLVRRRLCLVARLRQRVVVWRRRWDGGAKRSGSRSRVGPLDLRAPARGERRLHDRAAVGHRPALAQQHQPAGAALRRLELERDLRGAVRRSLHAARDRQLRRRRRRASTGRCAPTTTAATSI